LWQEIAPDLQSILPQGWSLTLSGNVFTLGRDEKVWLYNPVGLPGPLGEPEFGEMDAVVRKYGHERGYEIKLRFEPLLSEEEYERLKREREPFEKILNEGARTKSEWGENIDEYHKHHVPVYFTDKYSVYAEKTDAYPLKVHPESVAAECKQVIASLDGLFRRYEVKADRNSDF